MPWNLQKLIIFFFKLVTKCTENSRTKACLIQIVSYTSQSPLPSSHCTNLLLSLLCHVPVWMDRRVSAPAVHMGWLRGASQSAEQISINGCFLSGEIIQASLHIFSSSFSCKLQGSPISEILTFPSDLTETC